jgi:hypothetical protein
MTAMTRTIRRVHLAAALAGLLLPGVRSAGAVGLDGPAAADSRLGLGLGTGWDQVGGLGRDGFPFVEAFAHGDWRAWRWLYLGGAATTRGDLANYNFALERWRGGSPAVAAQALVGYDGPRFHLSAGSWFYGSRREGRPFRPALLPYGVLRLRAGALDRWHFNLRLVDGAPFTADGGGTGLRLQLAAPPRGRHRLAAGVYTSLGEKVVGITASDEIEGLALARGAALRVGGLLGTDLGHATRPELTLFAGLTW